MKSKHVFGMDAFILTFVAQDLTIPHNAKWYFRTSKV